VSEVRLFGAEGIQEELHLTISQWPSMHDRLLIHGYRYIFPAAAVALSCLV